MEIVTLYNYKREQREKMAVTSVSTSPISSTQSTKMTSLVVTNPISINFGSETTMFDREESDKQMLKAELNELVRKARALKEDSSKETKKALNERIKNLKEMAETAGVDLGELLGEILDTTNSKDSKKVQKALGIEATKAEEVEPQENNFMMNPFGRLSFADNASAQTLERKYTNPKAEGLNQEFLNKVKDIAGKLNCDHEDLLALMNHESGLNSKAVNKNGGATGLIQFMPSTAKALGTSVEELRNMSAIEQLDYVEKYMINAKKSAGFGSQRLEASDLASLGFLPARAKNEVLCRAGEGNNFYEHNSALDLNKDGIITKSELGQRLSKKYVNEAIFS